MRKLATRSIRLEADYTVSFQYGCWVSDHWQETKLLAWSSGTGLRALLIFITKFIWRVMSNFTIEACRDHGARLGGSNPGTRIIATITELYRIAAIGVGGKSMYIILDFILPDQSDYWTSFLHLTPSSWAPSLTVTFEFFASETSDLSPSP